MDLVSNHPITDHVHRHLESAFRSAPRFGYTNQFSDLFGKGEGNDQERVDYIIGICVVALILAVIFLCWFVFVLIFKCMGQQRVGFLSGASYEAKVGGQANTRPTWGRGMFGFGGLLYFTFTFTLVFVGFQNLENTTGEMADGVSIGQDIFKDGLELLEAFLKLAVQAGEVRDTVVETLEDVFETNITLAGLLPDNLLPENASLPELEALGINVTLPPEIEQGLMEVVDVVTLEDDEKFIFDGVDLRAEAVKAVDFLKGLDEFVDEPTRELNGALTKGYDMTGEVSDGLDSVKLRKLQLGFGIPLLIISVTMLALMGITAMGWNSHGSAQNCLTSWLIMPLFVFVLLFLIILTMGFAVGGIVDGDFCSGGPEETPEGTLRQILEKEGIDTTSTEFKVVTYMVNGCEFDIENPTIEDPVAFLNEFTENVDQTTADLIEFEKLIQEIGIVEIAARLAKNITAVDEHIKTMAKELEESVELLGTFLKELACIRIYEIYSKFVHDATCDKGQKGLLWTFLSFLLISFGGMLMLMFRAVLYPIAGDMDDYSWNEVKEKEMQNEGGGVSGDDDEVVGTNKYVTEEGINDNANNNTSGEQPATEAPMGGSATQAYEAVGDDNPFEDQAHA